MFATLAGDLPRPPTPDDRAAGADRAAADDGLALAATVALQVEHGLEPLTDGGALRDGSIVERWRRTYDAASGRAAKAIVAGPFRAERSRARVLAAAEAANATLRELADAGCPLIQVDAPDVDRIGGDTERRRLFVDASRRLLEGVKAHVSLALLGPAEGAGAATLFDPPFASYLFDLVGGPDDWRLIVDAPRERGIICGVARGAGGPLMVAEAMVWAAHYAASTQGRGLDRVGLATTGSLAGLDWDEAVRRVARLGRAARLAATTDPEALRRGMDPRAFRHRPARRRSSRPAEPREGPAEPREGPAEPREQPEAE